MEDWAEIRRLHRSEQVPIKAIARRLGISKNTVRRALSASEPPKYVRKPTGSVVDAVEPQIRALLASTPGMPATVIAERIGWTRGLTVLKDRVRALRPQYQPVDPVSRTKYQPGELAQCDLWFPPTDVPVGGERVARPPVLVMVSGYSRWLMARMIPSRQAHDLIGGHWALLSGLGAVPRALVWDNEPAVGSWKAGELLKLDIVDGFGRATKSDVAIYGTAGARVIVTSGNRVWEAEGEDLLVCLVGIRRQLEVDGLKLCCQGARRDVWPSGQLRQFTNGRFGYVLASAPVGEMLETVDLFAPADASEIGTVEEQREAVFRFHGLRQP